MEALRLLPIISWISIPTVMFGGYSLLRLTTHGQKLTPYQLTYFRAGHAHAGVLLILSLAYYSYLGQTGLPEGLRWVAGIILVVGILAQSGGFFLHMLLGKEGKPSPGTLMTSIGAVLLAFDCLWLAFLLITK